MSERCIYIVTETHTNGKEESVLIREVSSFQGLNCIQELFLGKEKVSIIIIREPATTNAEPFTFSLLFCGMSYPLYI